MTRTDFHSHILPKLDDGAADVNESVKLLDILKSDGITRVIATPHLYLHKHSLEDFLRARERSALSLFEAIKGRGYPEILLGAEVYFSPALGELPLRELCVAGTDYMLLELPYQSFSSAFMRSFSNFMSECNVNIILAHIERYFELNKPEIMDELLSYDVLTQANCDSLTVSRDRRKILKLIGSGKIQLLGTDLHSVKRRPPVFGDAEKIIAKKLSPEAFEKMMTAAEMTVKNEDIYDILSM